MKQIFQLPNLLSLSRILLLWPAAYFITRNDPEGTLWCVAIIVIAGLTDGLDGYLARRLNQVDRLGIALDPIADKIFVGGLVIMAIFYREFPVWLAAIVIGRDLLIMIVGGLLIRGTQINLSSNITGKFTFGALIALLFSHIIRYQFGIITLTIASLILLTASTILYARVMIKIKQGRPLKPYDDPVWLRWSRVIGSWIYVGIYFGLWLYQNQDLISL